MDSWRDYAQDNRPKVDEALDKAEAKLVQTNGGKHAETVTKVRASVDKGIDKLVEHNDRPEGASHPAFVVGARRPSFRVRRGLPRRLPQLTPAPHRGRMPLPHPAAYGLFSCSAAYRVVCRTAGGPGPRPR